MKLLTERVKKVNNAIDIKRGTTPTLPIRINIPFENIRHIDFVFKKQKSESYPELLKLSFEFPDDNDLMDKEENSFVVNAKFEEEDTRKLTKGTVYMDTRVVLTNNEIPPTEIVELDISETLFREVYNK